MDVEFLSAAEMDLAKVVSYYNDRDEGLGYAFVAEIEQTPCRIVRFPYAIVYQPRGDIVLIVAILHLHRYPDSWKCRVDHGTGMT
uniref:ParE toxin of type II toxin-antitoxin system, parDE n=1 Tax=Candidatus Kentrum sp. LFY TaxID=2126342 RepID=A0A450URG6_9GAMM|nr:MAG: hypothetical protein BECKLFY1418A_GA0070994_104613 [Candidatus Kentron sp. LFY]